MYGIVQCVHSSKGIIYCKNKPVMISTAPQTIPESVLGTDSCVQAECKGTLMLRFDKSDNKEILKLPPGSCLLSV